MQNRYVGDVGDFGKYGLLRFLFQKGCDYRLAIIWYLIPDEMRTNDGKHTKYLEKEQYKKCDEELFDILCSVVKSNRRNINEVEERKIFSEVTVFYNKKLFFADIGAYSQGQREERSNIRENWFKEALECSKSSNAVFLDPDNGMQTKKVKKYHRRGCKYVFLDEVERLAIENKIIVVYQHLGRSGTHLEQINIRINDIEQCLQERSLKRYIYALRFRPYSPRIFFIICPEDKNQNMHSRIQALLNTPWNQFFQWISRSPRDCLIPCHFEFE